jgi:hypothetical protein
MPVLRITQSQRKLLIPSLGRGLASSTSTLTVPSNTPSTPGASCTSDVDSTGVGIPRGAAIDRGDLEGTRARPPVLMADGATKGKYGGVTRCAAGQCVIRADEVRLLSP